MNPIRVLITDDHLIIREGLRLILETADDIDVVGEAADGAECLQLVPKLNPHLVLMDLQMPVMGGQDATREIRNNRQLKHQPVIVAVTGYALTGVRESCYESGMNEFLTKPVSLDTLRDTLTRSLVAEGRV